MTGLDGADAAELVPAPLRPGESEIERLTEEVGALRCELRALRETIAQALEPTHQHVARPTNGLAPQPATRQLAPPRPLGRGALLIGALGTRIAADWRRVQALPLTSVPTTIRRTIEQGRTRREWAPPRPLLCSLVALVAITAVAFALRGIHVARIPPGVHGDEAATGLAARQILDTGWIGVYSGIAGGNPTGVYYLATIPISLIHDPVVAIRILSAIIGTIGVSALFVLVLRNAGFGSAMIAATLFAFSEWHIQFSRIGFVTGDWPTFVLFGAIALMEAIRSGAWYWWAAAGALLASGTYVYNGNTPILPIIVGFVLFSLFGWRILVIGTGAILVVVHPSILTAVLLLATCMLLFSKRLRNRRDWVNLVSFAVGSLITLRGMIDFARAHPQDYFGRGRNLSVFETDQWRAATSTSAKAHLLLDRYTLFWNRLTFDPRPNGADLSGVTPLVPKVMFAICLIGLVLALIRRPTPLALFSVAIVALAPFSAALTDMTLRRALVIAPFLAVLGGIGMIELLRLAIGHEKRLGIIVGILIALAIGVSSLENYTDFFDKTVPSGAVRATFPVELRSTSDYMASLSPDDYVYLYSDNWGIKYDVVQLIAPNVHGEDRLPKWGGDGTYDAHPPHGRAVFIFVGLQAANVQKVVARYPGGELVYGPVQGAPLNGPGYVAYVLPAASP